MSIGKRIGYVCLSFLPFVGMILLQNGIMFGCITGLVLSMLQQGKGGNLFSMAASAILTEHYMELMILIQILTLLVFGLWYYLTCVHGSEGGKNRTCMTVRKAAAIPAASLGLYLLISVYMVIMQWAAPTLTAQYEKLIDVRGIADLTILSTLASLLLAPLGEEIIFRGLTFQYLRKAGAGFWFANILQAALFGAAHLNWIQSSYTFVMGMILGCILRRFRTLAAPILFHMFFNFWGTYLASAISGIPAYRWFPLAEAGIGILALVFAGRLLKGGVSEPLAVPVLSPLDTLVEQHGDDAEDQYGSDDQI